MDTIFYEIITSGALGTIHYWMFNEEGLFDFFDKRKTDEKNSLLLILTAINLIFLDLFSNVSFPELINSIIIKIFLSFIISGIVSWGVFSFVKWNNKRINKKKHDKGDGYIEYHPIFEVLAEEKTNVDRLIIIYDFENKIIDVGYLISYTTGTENHFELTIDGINWDEIETDYNVLRSQLQQNTNEAMIFISFEYNVKILMRFVERE